MVQYDDSLGDAVEHGVHQFGLLAQFAQRALACLFRFPLLGHVAKNGDAPATPRHGLAVYHDEDAFRPLLVADEYLFSHRLLASECSDERYVLGRETSLLVCFEEAVPAAPLVGSDIQHPDSHDPLRRRVEQGEITVLVGGDDAIAHGCEHGPHQLIVFLGFAKHPMQLQIRLPLRRDVPDYCDGPDGFPVVND